MSRRKKPLKVKTKRVRGRRPPLLLMRIVADGKPIPNPHHMRALNRFLFGKSVINRDLGNLTTKGGTE